MIVDINLIVNDNIMCVSVQTQKPSPEFDTFGVQTQKPSPFFFASAAASTSFHLQPLLLPLLLLLCQTSSPWLLL